MPEYKEGSKNYEDTHRKEKNRKVSLNGLQQSYPGQLKHQNNKSNKLTKQSRNLGPMLI